MWRPAFGVRTPDEVPIGHVTNGVHVPTWMAAPMRELLERHLGTGWETRSSDPATWKNFDAIPDAELWDVRCQLRASLVEYLRDRATWTGSRAANRAYVQLAAHDRNHHRRPRGG
jgi:starch phosphorylase